MQITICMSSGDVHRLNIKENIQSITSLCEIVGYVHVHSMFLTEDESDELKKKYPNGVKVVVVNDQVCHA